MTRAQAAVEFTLISVFMLFAFAVTIVITEVRYANIQEERFQASVEDILDAFESEIILADRAGIGYERNLTLPHTLGGIPYEVGINQNQTVDGKDELWLRTRGDEYLRFLEIDVDGRFGRGRNTIRHEPPVTIYPPRPPLPPIFQGLVAYYDLDSDFRDQHATLHLAPVGTVQTPAIINSGRTFDGIDDHATMPGPAHSTFQGSMDSSALTVSAWIWLNHMGDHGIIGDYTNTGDYGFALYHRGGWLRFAVGNATAGAEGVAGRPAVISVDTWHHVVGTYDGATVRLYVDGAPLPAQGVVAYAGGAEFNTAGAFCIGSLRPDCVTSSAESRVDTFLDGAVDEIGIWNRALSAAEVAELYNASNGYPYPAYP